jgi:hypothetical protein
MDSQKSNVPNRETQSEDLVGDNAVRSGRLVRTKGSRWGETIREAPIYAAALALWREMMTVPALEVLAPGSIPPQPPGPVPPQPPAPVPPQPPRPVPSPEPPSPVPQPPSPGIPSARTAAS